MPIIRELEGLSGTRQDDLDDGIIAAAVAASWTPSNLTQAIARYQWSNMGVFNDLDPVTTWPDIKGSFNAISDTTRKPLYRTAGYVSFDGTDDFMDTGIATAFGDFAVFIVFRMFNMTEAASRVLDKSVANGFWVGTETTGTGNLGGGIVEGAPFGTFYTAAPNTFYAMLFQRAGTTKTTRFAGVSNTAVVPATALDGTSLLIAKDSSTALYGQIDLKELVVCNDDIAGADLTNLIAYASSQYGLTL